jgi:hypothetical protein
MVFMIVFFTIVLGFVVLALIRMYSGWESGESDGPNSDEGPPWRRGGGRPPKGPRPRSPEPSWWPEFEREFRLYAKAQRGRREVTGVS